MAKTVWERFAARAVVGDGCWEWPGKRTADGYGQFWDGTRVVYVHRFAYELLAGPIPAGLTIDHLCRNRRCWRPDHLEPVSIGVNVRRGMGWAGRHARAQNCPQGHPYSSTNTAIDGGKRKCRECMNARSRRYHRVHAAVLKERKREYYLANREAILAKAMTRYHGRHKAIVSTAHVPE